MKVRGNTELGPVVHAPLEADLRVGTELAGYRIDELVGRGGMGVVYRAEHLHLQRTVALKLLVPELSHGEGFRKRFVREARTAAAIQHPNVVTVFDAGEADGLLYIAMQYVDGTDLAALLERDGALDLERTLSIVTDVGAGLDAAHELDIVHRDVKPGNILLGGDRAYLADFGLMRAMSASAPLTQGEVVGTVDYIAPEQIEGGAIDGRADVYALGCVLYHCLTGAVPYEKDSQIAVIYAHLQEQPTPPALKRPGLPAALDEVLATALAKRPQDRFASGGELVAALRTALGQSGASPDRPSARRVPRPKVLVAAGETSVRAAIAVSLDSGRFELFEVDDGRQAVQTACREKPDLVIVDWGLPGLSGAEVCRVLREQPATAAAKIIALSARSEGLDERIARAAGADAHVAKPFSSLQLLYAVGDLVGHEIFSS